MKNMRLFSFFLLGMTLFAQSKAPAPAKKTVTAAVPAKAAPARKSAFDKAALEAYVRHLGVYGPNITVTISDPKPSTLLPGFMEVKVHAAAGAQFQDEVFLVSKDGQKFFRPPVYDITQNPFKPDLDKLKTDSQPGFGPAGAPVVIVAFSDYQCPYCREEAKILRENLKKEYPTQVRLYYRDFPLEAIHDWAKPAAIAGRCVFRQNANAFWDYHDWIYENQAKVKAENLKTMIMEWATGKGLDALALGRCIDTKATESEVNKSQADGKELNVDRTPYLFINGRRVPGGAWAQLKQIIDYELEYQTTAQNAGEQACCTLSLPSLIAK